MRSLRLIPLVLLLLNLIFAGCGQKASEEINVGFIGPLSGNALDLGVAPSKAIALAIKQYNEQREPDSPKVNFYIEDDEWVGGNALPLYEKLRSEHAIDVLFISHTDGTIALQDKILEDDVILINSINNDDLLAGMNGNTFVVGKKTEEAAEVVAARVIELGKRKVRGFYVTNSFMTISAEAFSARLESVGIDVSLIPVDIERVSYLDDLSKFKEETCDALAFFGYKNLGYAMKQARSSDIDADFFASTTTLGDGYFENSEGAMVGTEFSFFTANDGNYILARQFLDRYDLEYGVEPRSVWPPMQAYDAANMLLSSFISNNRQKGESLASWIKRSMHNINYYQGVCGNLAIKNDGSSRGIYFSLYEVVGEGTVRKVKR